MVSRIDRNDIGVAVIDVQPFFLDLASPDGGRGHESLLFRLEHLLMLAYWMDLPTVTTFEKPAADNGELPDRLEALFPTSGQRFAKNQFGSMPEPDIREGIAGMGVRKAAVAGAGPMCT